MGRIHPSFAPVEVSVVQWCSSPLFTSSLFTPSPLPPTVVWSVSSIPVVSYLYFCIWKMKRRRLMFLAASSLLHSTLSLMGSRAYSVSLASLEKTWCWMTGLIFTSSYGPFRSRKEHSSAEFTLLFRMSWKESVRLQDRLGLRSESLIRAFSTQVWFSTVKRGVS